MLHTTVYHGVGTNTPKPVTITTISSFELGSVCTEPIVVVDGYDAYKRRTAGVESGMEWNWDGLIKVMQSYDARRDVFKLILLAHADLPIR